MGVHGLTGILTRFAPKAVQKVSCSAFSRQTVAIDASCHLNKFIYGDEPHPFRHIYGFYLLARFCDLNNINPIFVFDGPTRLKAKQLEHAKRARTRKKVKYSLLFEKEQSTRLDNWLYASSNDSLISEETAITILNELGDSLQKIEDSAAKQTTISIPNEQHEIETKLFQTAQELRIAIETAENTDKYTRTVRNLVNRELELISEMAKNGFHYTKPSLEMLKKDNEAMLTSLEKRSVRITQDIREECQGFLEKLGYLCFSCDNHEAEAMCAHFAKAGRTSATISEDMDTLVFGNVPILRYFFSRGRPILMIDPIIARKELGLSRDAFIDFCILCGTDFSGTIQGIGPNRALNSIQKYGSIEELLKNLESRFVPQNTFDYKLAREVFNDLPPIPMNEEAYKRPPTSDIHMQHLLQHYQIDKEEADVKLRMALFQQTVIDSHIWGSDPFSQTTVPPTIMANLANF